MSISLWPLRWTGSINGLPAEAAGQIKLDPEMIDFAGALDRFDQEQNEVNQSAA